MIVIDYTASAKNAINKANTHSDKDEAKIAALAAQAWALLDVAAAIRGE